MQFTLDTHGFARNTWQPLALWVAAVILAAGGCRSESGDSQPIAATGPRYAAEREKGTDAKHPVVRFETNLGVIGVRLDAERAPVTVRNFLDYAADGFYTNTLFHYVAPDKMILGGGFTPDGLPKAIRLPILMKGTTA